MAEINTTNPRYRKHLQSIAGACILAEEYMRAPVIPKPLSEYNASLTYAALDMEPPARPDSAHVENEQTPGSSIPVTGEAIAGPVGSAKGRVSGSNSISLRNPQVFLRGGGQQVSERGKIPNW